MIRIASIVIAVWTLLAAPSLCQTGVLLHDCHGSTCGHEATCDADPCSETAIKANTSGSGFVMQAVTIVLAVEFAPPVDPAAAATSNAQTECDNPPSAKFKLPLLV